MSLKSKFRSQSQSRRQLTQKTNWGAAILALLGMGLVGGFLLTSGCAQSTSSNATTFTEIYNASFSTSCLTCHCGSCSADNLGVTLDFSNADTAYNQLVNTGVQMPSSPSSSCRNLKRVTANSPSTSYLMAILFSSYRTTGFGGQSDCVPYPLQHDNLVSESEKSSIESWINAGAGR